MSNTHFVHVHEYSYHEWCTPGTKISLYPIPYSVNDDAGRTELCSTEPNFGACMSHVPSAVITKIYIYFIIIRITYGQYPYIIMIRTALIVSASLAVASAKGGEHLKAAGEGVKNVIDGAGNVISGAVDHVEAKADQFVDTAGNVYTVLKDATGSATNLVMDAAGAIFDVTKLAGSFVINHAMAYPGEVMGSIQDSAAELRQGLASMGDVAGALAGAAYKPSLPPMKEMLHPSSWIQAGHENFMKSSDAMSEISAAFSAPYNAFEDKYCKPAALRPSVKKPTKVTMPGFELTIKMGECTVANETVVTDCIFNKNCSKDDLMLDCKKPSMAYGHTNGTIVYKHHTPVEFKTKECKIEKEHGKKDELVLFEFAEHNVDLKSLADQVSATVGNAVGALASGATNLAQDAAEFVGGLKHEKADFDEFVSKYDGLP
jgi:hypothetical protein